MASLLKHLTFFLSLACGCQLLPLGHSCETKPITITLVNNCDQVICPAFLNVADSADNPYGGSLQPGGGCYDIQVDNYEGRIWPRTGCTPDGLKCTTGDCGGERCTAYATGDYTFAELIHRCDSGDYVNIGLKYANQVNIPMEFKPGNTYSEQQCETLTCMQTGCGNNMLSAACKIPNTFTLTFCPNT